LLNRRLAAEQEDKLFDQQLLLQDQLPNITSDIARLSLHSHLENSPLDDMSGLMIPREKGLPSACIFVAHLEKSVDDRFLHQALFITMAKFGTILDLQVHRDPRYFRPYAFVQFKVRRAKTIRIREPINYSKLTFSYTKECGGCRQSSKDIDWTTAF
jgi:hypothetical protein